MLKLSRWRSKSTPGGDTDKIAVVGLPDTAVKESKDRVTSAISNSAFRWAYGKRITINLAPADVRKEGPSFDLPIALGMLAGSTEQDLDFGEVKGQQHVKRAVEVAAAQRLARQTGIANGSPLRDRQQSGLRAPIQGLHR